MKTTTTALLLFLAAASSNDALAFRPQGASHRGSLQLQASSDENAGLSRRDVFATVASTAITASSVARILTSGGLDLISQPEPANAIGPVKINLMNPKYSAIPCPKDKPIPGEKAMKGMKGLCVTVDVDLEEIPDRELEKIGVYGYVTDKGTGESVLANNPDLSTDAGQFAIIEKITKADKKTQFEFIAAVPREMVCRKNHCLYPLALPVREFLFVLLLPLVPTLTILILLLCILVIDPGFDPLRGGNCSPHLQVPSGGQLSGRPAVRIDQSLRDERIQ